MEVERAASQIDRQEGLRKKEVARLAAEQKRLESAPAPTTKCDNPNCEETLEDERLTVTVAGTLCPQCLLHFDNNNGGLRVNSNSAGPSRLTRAVLDEFDKVKSRYKPFTSLPKAAGAAAGLKKSEPFRGIVQPEVSPPPGQDRHRSNQLEYIATQVEQLWVDVRSLHFREPVDAIKLNLPDYFRLVLSPMDLGTIRSRLSNNFYRHAGEALDDINLMLDNCLFYNGPQTEIAQIATDLLQWRNGMELAMPPLVPAPVAPNSTNVDQLATVIGQTFPQTLALGTTQDTQRNLPGRVTIGQLTAAVDNAIRDLQFNVMRMLNICGNLLKTFLLE